MANKKQKKPIERISTGASDGVNGGLARALGSTEAITREAGIQSMTTWLSRKKDVTEHDVMRLWKAIFYCYWHSDLVPVQMALAERLSEIISQLPENVGEIYFKSFIRTMRREWFGIDHLRLDKYMSLVRKFYTQHLRFLESTGWDSKKLQSYAKFWTQEVLLPTDATPAVGFAYHLVDLLVPQLLVVLEESNTALDDATFRALLKPYVTALATTTDQALSRRISQGLFEPLIDEVSKGNASLVMKKVDVGGLASYLFDIGADKDTRVKNREALYAISVSFEKAAKKRQHIVPSPAAAVVVAAKIIDEIQSGTKKQKKRKHEAEQANGVHKVVKGEVLANATVATEEEEQQKQKKKAKKDKHNEKAAAKSSQQQPTPMDLDTAGISNIEFKPTAASPKTTPTLTLSAKKQKKQQLQAAAAAPATDSKALQLAKKQKQSDNAPVKNQLASADNVSTKKKNVRFSLKSNLVMTIGGPVPSPDVRTPPTAQPKGPALKQNSTTGGGSGKNKSKSNPSRLQQRYTNNISIAGDAGVNGTGSSTHTPKSNGKNNNNSSSSHSSGGKRSSGSKEKKRVTRSASVKATPHSIPRPRASQFF